MVRPEASAVVLALVAEQRAERLQPKTVPNQSLPIVVTDLMAKVPEERAVRLRHVLARALALGVVGLGDVDGDQPLRMARHNLRGVLERPGGSCEEVEGKPGFRIFRLADQRQAEPKEGVDQPVLSGLQALPAQ